MPTIRTLLDDAAEVLAGRSDSPRLDAECLLTHVLELSRTALFTWPDREIDALASGRFNALLYKRVEGVPVAYLTGEREFWSLPFRVTDATLIPRPETETLVEFVLEHTAERTLDVIDLGTGSGAIACALASERPHWRITATDISPEALAVARRNAEQLGLGPVQWVHSDWFGALGDRAWDVIVCNPPYVPERDPHLQQGDVRFEPASALRSGADGLDDIHRLTRQAPAHLRAGGWLVLEHGYDQRDAVRRCFLDRGFREIEQREDLSGQPRMTAGRIARPQRPS